MPTITERLESAVTILETDKTIQHQIIHGGPTTIVSTEGGPVKSYAKSIADMEGQYPSVLFADGSANITCSSAGSLRALSVSGLINNQYAFLLGYYIVGDGGGGWFVYNSASSATDDGCLTIAPNAGAGRWLRVVNEGLFNVKWAGAKLDNSTDDSAKVTIANTSALATKTILSFPGIAKISGTVTITANILDTANQIFSVSGTLTIDNAQPVRPDWFGSRLTVGVIKKAVDALPFSGGSILFRPLRYAQAGWGTSHTPGTAVTEALTKSNVTFICPGNPVLNSAQNQLEGGVAIDGPLFIRANNFTIIGHLGVDSGTVTTDANYGGAVKEGFIHTYMGSEATRAKVNNFRFDAVTGLCRSGADPVHAVLIEGINTVNGGLARGIKAIHGVVVKSINVNIDRAEAVLCNGEGVIIKSDAGAECYNVNITSVSCDNCSNWGLLLNALQSSTLATINIKSITLLNTAGNPGTYGLGGTASSGSIINDVVIGTVVTDNYPVGIYCHDTNNGVGDFRRWRIDHARVLNCDYGVVIRMLNPTASEEFTIGALEIANMDIGPAISLYNNTSLTIDTFLQNVSITGYAYSVANTSRLSVGREKLIGNRWDTGVIVLNSDWEQHPNASNSLFAVVLNNHKVQLQGLIRPKTGFTTLLITTLPVYLRPAKAIRFSVPALVSAAYQTLELIIDAAGAVSIANLPANTDYVDIGAGGWFV